jgi:hypothetical protein
MIDLVAIICAGGIVLYSASPSDTPSPPPPVIVNTFLTENFVARTTRSRAATDIGLWNHDQHTIRWKLLNNQGLIFMV